eukprot:COSAG04_NODE_10064_length_808_cov_0.874471_1_plen_113_part_10
MAAALLEDEEALADALRVLLHENPDLRPQDAAASVGAPKAQQAVVAGVLGRLREQEDYAALQAWEGYTADEKGAAYAVASTWLRAALRQPGPVLRQPDDAAGQGSSDAVSDAV